MSLPAPNLDDRRFQDLVDDAKRLVQQRCPEWTDHNVSDPGVTLIEAFAQMTDQLLYRLNRVPERHYIKFLELLGLSLFPPTAATVEVTFRLSAAQDQPVMVPVGTEVATVQSENVPAVTFTTTEELEIVPVSRARVLSNVTEGEFTDHTVGLDGGVEFFCFDDVPKVDDALLVGLSDPAPRCAVAIDVDCSVDGVGVDPTNPPLEWEAWTGNQWQACDVEQDDTGAFNRPGAIVMHIPDGHEASVLGGQRGAWLRCRVIAAREGQPTYTSSPVIRRLDATVVGGTTRAVNAEIVTDEVIGRSSGTAAQSFTLVRSPVVPAAGPVRVEVAGDQGWEPWQVVDNFADSGPTSPHCVLDYNEGTVRFGPSVRQADGSVRQYGVVPGQGRAIRIREYLTGGGREGNVARGAIQVLRTSIPLISRVENRRAAQGGVNGESVENAKARGPIMLRTRDRAVTAADYEHLTIEAAPEVARVRCVSATDPADAGSVRILVVPSVASDRGRIEFGQLIPADPTMERIADHLDQRRTVGARVLIEPPLYQGVTVVARIRATPGYDVGLLEERAMTALYGRFGPLDEGDEPGWPFGRPISVGDVYSVLQKVDGVDFIADARLFAADPVSGDRGDSVQQIDLDPNALAFSYDHQILVEAG